MKKILIILFLVVSVGANLFILGRSYLQKQRQFYYDLAVYNIVQKAQQGVTTVIIPQESGELKKYELVIKQ